MRIDDLLRPGLPAERRGSRGLADRPGLDISDELGRLDNLSDEWRSNRDRETERRQRNATEGVPYSAGPWPLAPGS
jgi:hypothetical protein